MEKKCSKCGQTYPLTAEFFYKRSGRATLQSECKTCQSQRLKKHDAMVKKEVFERYGNGGCACCGEKFEEFLSIDHIDGMGGKHRRDIGVKGGSKFYRWLRNNDFPKGFRVLCMNCNSSLGFRGYCPHNKLAKEAPCSM